MYHQQRTVYILARNLNITYLL